MDMNEAVAKAIGAERDIAGMTVRELSEVAQIPLSSLMRILGAEREIKVNQVAKIAEAFRLYPHEIIEHAETILERANRSAVRLTMLDRDELDLAAMRGRKDNMPDTTTGEESQVLPYDDF